MKVRDVHEKKISRGDVRDDGSTILVAPARQCVQEFVREETGNWGSSLNQ